MPTGARSCLGQMSRKSVRAVVSVCPLRYPVSEGATITRGDCAATYAGGSADAVDEPTLSSPTSAKKLEKFSTRPSAGGRGLSQERFRETLVSAGEVELRIRLSKEKRKEIRRGQRMSSARPVNAICKETGFNAFICKPEPNLQAPARLMGLARAARVRARASKCYRNNKISAARKCEAFAEGRSGSGRSSVLHLIYICLIARTFWNRCCLRHIYSLIEQASPTTPCKAHHEVMCKLLLSGCISSYSSVFFFRSTIRALHYTGSARVVDSAAGLQRKRIQKTWQSGILKSCSFTAHRTSRSRRVYKKLQC